MAKDILKIGVRLKKIDLGKYVPDTFKDVEDPEEMSTIAAQMLKDKVNGMALPKQHQKRIAFNAGVEALTDGGFRAAGLPHPNSVAGKVDRSLRALSKSKIGKWLHGD